MTTSAPTVLWVVPVPELGGVARHVTDAARHGIPGFRVVVLCPEGALAATLRAQGSAVTTGPFGPGHGFAASVRTLRATARALRPAIVHSHLAYADLVNAATPLPRGTRRFTTEHGIAGDDAVYHRSRGQAMAMAVVHHVRLRRFDGAIAVSEATRGAMVAKWRPTIDIDVVPNGVDVPEGYHRASAAEGTVRVLSLARLSPEKRIDRLLEAFALLTARVPDARLTIAGEGPLEQELRDLARRLGVSESVAFPGFVVADRAAEQADVVAQLSVWENCSYTLLDARARGLGVVASDAGGNREIIGAGSLVDADDLEAVVSAMVRESLRRGPSETVRTVREMCVDYAARYVKGIR